jgi:DNA-directed RNA polymerase subunit RPC12/RpoP
MNYPLKEFADFWNFEKRQVGLAIRCPNCGEARMAFFKNPIGGGDSPKTQGHMWDRTGDTLETLSLTPSFRAIGHYHSWIKNGELQVDSPFACQKRN